MLSTCVRRMGSSFAKFLNCHPVTIAEICFGNISDADTLKALQDCLESANCGTPELGTTTKMAAYISDACQGNEHTKSAEQSKLRRRRSISLSVDVQGQDTADVRLHNRDTTTTDGSEATTTAASGTTDTNESTTTETTDTTATSTTDTTATATGTGTTTTSLVCSTEKETSVTSCDATSTYDCSLVATTTSVCADGLYCTTDTAGNHLCMVEQDGLTTSGAIVTIILAVILATIIGTISTLCIRDRMERKRRYAKLQAAAIAKDSSATESLLDHGALKSHNSFAPNAGSPEHTQEPGSSRNPFSG